MAKIAERGFFVHRPPVSTIENYPDDSAVAVTAYCGTFRVDVLITKVITGRGNSFTAPVWRTPESITDQFNRLADEWESSTAVMSSPTQKENTAAFPKLMSLGSKVTTLALRRLVENNTDWHLFLIKTVKDKPDFSSVRGDARALRRVWLEWGQRHDLLR